MSKQKEGGQIIVVLHSHQSKMFEIECTIRKEAEGGADGVEFNVQEILQ
jgi:hypothetical protein